MKDAKWEAADDSGRYMPKAKDTCPVQRPEEQGDEETGCRIKCNARNRAG
jgi:hypothetical protein